MDRYQSLSCTDMQAQLLAGSEFNVSSAVNDSQVFKELSKVLTEESKRER